MSRGHNSPAPGGFVILNESPPPRAGRRGRCVRRIIDDDSTLSIRRAAA
jgi:hypothetical protein